MSPSKVKRMKRICARLDVTPFQFLLTAFRCFIYRYTREDDLTILMVDGSRPHSKVDDVLGFFVNLIPLRLQHDCDCNFDRLIPMVKQTVLDGLAHSRVNFDAIVQATGKQPSRNQFPFSQLLFNYQVHGKPPTYRTSHFDIHDVSVEDIPTACDLKLEALESPSEGLNLRLEYDPYLYGASETERFFENFLTFTRSVIHDFRQPTSEIEMCGPKETENLRLNCWNVNSKANEWNGQSIWNKIVDVTKQEPTTIAVRTSAGEEISYGDLVTKAEQTASSLLKAGAEPGQYVGVLADPSINTVAAIMGITHIRCGYVPLDPNFAWERLAYMIRDSGTSILLIGEGFDDMSDTLLGDQQPLVVISLSSISTTSLRLGPRSSGPHDPFYIIYTSVS